MDFLTNTEILAKQQTLIQNHIKKQREQYVNYNDPECISVNVSTSDTVN